MSQHFSWEDFINRLLMNLGVLQCFILSRWNSLKVILFVWNLCLVLTLHIGHFVKICWETWGSYATNKRLISYWESFPSSNDWVSFKGLHQISFWHRDNFRRGDKHFPRAFWCTFNCWEASYWADFQKEVLFLILWPTLVNVYLLNIVI